MNDDFLIKTVANSAEALDLRRTTDRVALINGDSLCRWPLRKLIRRFQSDGALATLLLTVLLELRRRGLKRGLATACIGGGQGIAALVETV